MTSDAIAEQKSRLRAEAFARRDALSPAAREAASQAIAAQVLALEDLVGLAPVGAYWPMRSEVDPRPILRALIDAGTTVALSQTRHPVLSWRGWRPGDALVPAGFGVQEPGPEAPEVSPSALLVPLCAFDRDGNRLGYGKGHFDRSIAALAENRGVLTIGLAFALQEVDAVPHEPHDRRLDLVVTEREVIRPVRAVAQEDPA